VTRLGNGVHSSRDGDRIFVGPTVARYDREDGGEVIVVERDDRGTDSESEASTDADEPP
jgi:hypothetical protein